MVGNTLRNTQDNEHIEFNGDWVRFLQKPREELQKFCGHLFFFKCSEDAFKNGTKFFMITGRGTATFEANCAITEPDRIEKTHIIDRVLMFIYESVEAGFLKNPVTKIDNGEQLYRAIKNYAVLQHAPQHYTPQETMLIQRSYIQAKTEITGYINPLEVVLYLHDKEIGKEFLPESLLKHIEREFKPKPKRVSKNQGNRSGSRINPVKHAHTKEACQKAWEKIQEEKMLGLNTNMFHEIAASFLSQDESLVTTVSRNFYRKHVTKEYKAGAGRKSKY